MNPHAGFQRPHALIDNGATLSEDVVAYYWADDLAAANGSSDVATVEIVGGRCGPNPSPPGIDAPKAAIGWARSLDRQTLRGRRHCLLARLQALQRDPRRAGAG